MHLTSNKTTEGWNQWNEPLVRSEWAEPAACCSVLHVWAHYYCLCYCCLCVIIYVLFLFMCYCFCYYSLDIIIYMLLFVIIVYVLLIVLFLFTCYCYYCLCSICIHVVSVYVTAADCCSLNKDLYLRSVGLWFLSVSGLFGGVSGLMWTWGL